MKKQVLLQSIFVLIALFAAPPRAHTHPVIHEGGIVLSATSKPTFREWTASYSPRRWANVGLKYFDLNHQKASQIVLGTVGILPWRGNFEDSQANFYLTVGAGWETSLTGNNFASFLSPEVDWENRWLMTSLKYELFPVLSNRPSNLLRGRIGIAAFPAETNELNIWLLFQADYHKIEADVIPVTFHPSQNLQAFLWTPILRMTYRTAVLELGTADNGAVQMNFEVHY